MRFLLDENVDVRLGDHLRAFGHDVIEVQDMPGSAASDVEVLAAALSDRRVLITNDTDFGELVSRRGLPHAGVVLLRLQTTALAAKVEALDRVLREYPDRLGEYLVASEGQIRVRRLHR